MINLIELEYINPFYPLEEMSFLTNHSQLRVLKLPGHQIQDFHPVSNLVQLEQLDISNNNARNLLWAYFLRNLSHRDANGELDGGNSLLLKGNPIDRKVAKGEANCPTNTTSSAVNNFCVYRGSLQNFHNTWKSIITCNPDLDQNSCRQGLLSLTTMRFIRYESLLHRKGDNSLDIKIVVDKLFRNEREFIEEDDGDKTWTLYSISIDYRADWKQISDYLINTISQNIAVWEEGIASEFSAET